LPAQPWELHSSWHGLCSTEEISQVQQLPGLASTVSPTL